MHTPIHIERKDWSLVQTAALMLRGLSQANISGRPITVKEAVHLTGVPLEGARGALLYLAGALNGEVELRDDVLTFRFDDLDTRPWLLRVPRRLRSTAHWIGRFFQSLGATVAGGVLSTTFGLMLVSYLALILTYFPAPQPWFATVIVMILCILIFLAFVPLLTILLTISVLLSFFYVVWEAPLIGLFSVLFYIPTFMLLLSGSAFFVRRYQGIVDRLGGGLRAFTNFGRVVVGALEDEREFLALIKSNSGRVSTGDLAVLYGWSIPRAFRELTQLMLDYGGDVEVDADGRMLFVFESLSDGPQTERPKPIWERERRPSQLFGPKARRADKIMGGIWVLTLLPMVLALNLLWPMGQGLWNAFIGSDAPMQAVATAGVLMTSLLPLYVMFRRWVVARREAAYAKRERLLVLLQRAVNGQGRVTTQLDAIENDIVLDLGGMIDEESASHDSVELHFRELEHVQF